MSGSWKPQNFPEINNENHVITSPSSRAYNCFAWAADETGRWWEPDPLGIYYWPSTVPRKRTLDSVKRAYGTRGYYPCRDGLPKIGFRKITIYAIKDSVGRLVPTHAARQLSNGRWTSKIGIHEDIEHIEEDALKGPLYGEVVCYLERPGIDS